MNTRAIVVAMVLCTAAIITAIAWPRFMPRYEEFYGGVRDRWTGDECSTALSDLALRDYPLATVRHCWFADKPGLRQENGGRWKSSR